MREWQLKEMQKKADMINRQSYQRDGIYYWQSNDRVVPPSTFEEAGLEVPVGQREAREKQSSEFLADYRKKMENHESSDEELFEMRSAFGEGERVVNVITGKVTQL